MALGRVQIASPREQLSEPQRGCRLKCWQSLCFFVRRTRMREVAEAIVSKAQVVGDLSIGCVPRMQRLEKGLRIFVAQQGDRQTPRTFSGSEAIRKSRQCLFVVLESVEISPIQFIVPAELNPVVI